MPLSAIGNHNHIRLLPLIVDVVPRIHSFVGSARTRLASTGGRIHRRVGHIRPLGRNLRHYHLQNPYWNLVARRAHIHYHTQFRTCF